MIELLCTDYNKKATSIHYYFGNAVLVALPNRQFYKDVLFQIWLFKYVIILFEHILHLFIS